MTTRHPTKQNKGLPGIDIGSEHNVQLDSMVDRMTHKTPTEGNDDKIDPTRTGDGGVLRESAIDGGGDGRRMLAPRPRPLDWRDPLNPNREPRERPTSALVERNLP